MEKKQFETPSIEILAMNEADVIATSTTGEMQAFQFDNFWDEE